MLRALLAERFKLVVHNESRERPVYALVPARNDQRLGPHLHPTTTDCVALAPQSTLREKEGKEKSKEERGSATPATPAPGPRPPGSMKMGPGRRSGAVRLATLGPKPSGAVQRT